MTPRPRALALALVLAVAPAAAGFTACAATTPYYDYTKEPDPRNLEYVIGVADGLQITVWKNDDLSTSAVVRPDGTITMPLIGDIKAVGRTPTELRAEVKQRMSAFIKDESAVVTVAVTAVNSYRFTVSGNVEGPGVYSAQNYVTVSEAVALAGGPNKFASRAGLVLIRQDRKTGKFRRIPINYDDIRSNKRPEANLVLMPGDTIYLP
jgi:polysaccharide export outer membrane protein